MVINISLYRFLVGVDEDSYLSPFSLLFATAARVPLQSVWGPSFSEATLQTAVMILDDSASAGAPKLATDCLVYLQWASHLTNLGDLGKKKKGSCKFMKNMETSISCINFLKISWHVKHLHMAFLRTVWQFLKVFICKVLPDFAQRSFRTSLTNSSNIYVVQIQRQVYTVHPPQ